MEDHHVDRPGVEAQQCVKLTGTNRSFGLIRSFRRMQGPDPRRQRHASTTTQLTALIRQRTEIRAQRTEVHLLLLFSDLCPPSSAFRSDDLVVMARGHTPDPIPNSAVKLLSADGTMSQDLGE